MPLQKSDVGVEELAADADASATAGVIGEGDEQTLLTSARAPRGSAGGIRESGDHRLM